MNYLVIETEATQNQINEFHSKTNGGKVLWSKFGETSGKWATMIKFYGASEIELIKQVFNVNKVSNAPV